MEPDSYRIEVLHFLNPHLIWVEVVPTEGKNGEYKFEQVGIYGLMPMEVTIDMVDGSVKGQKSLEWTPAICKVMAQVFGNATEVWFRPVFLDRSTSIFDSNIHKYGEITVKTSDGLQKDVSALLAKSCFAYQDSKIFLNELASSNLKTKLDAAETKAVVKALERYDPKDPKKNWEKSFKSHTTVTKAAEKLESALTESNLQQHNRKLSAVLKNKNIHDIMEQKFKDFELCKDVDEVSVGKGVTPKQKLTEKKVSPIQKKMQLFKNIQSSNPMKEFVDTKKLLLKLAQVKARNDVPEETTDDTASAVADEKTWVFDKAEMDSKCSEELKIRPGFERGESVEPPSTVGGVSQNILRKKMKKKGPKVIIPGYDEEKEVRIAIGPPEIDQKTLPLKVIPKTEDFQGYGEENEEGKIDVTSKKTMSGLDSDVDSKNNKKDFVRKDEQKSIETGGKCAKNICEKVTEKLKLLKKVDLDNSSSSNESDKPKIPNSILKRSRLFQQMNASSSTDTTVKDSSSTESKLHEDDSDNETTLSKIVARLDIVEEKVTKKPSTQIETVSTENNVNPFKNIDPEISKFVDKLVTPLLMVHTSNRKRIQPVYEISNVNFNSNIFSVLARNRIKHPMILQTVTWYTILRGYSVFMIGPKGCGKTVGYVPAVCRLVEDFNDKDIPESVGPVCVIVCATTKSVIEVERQCKQFLEQGKNVVAYYAGLDEMEITTSLLNGCHVLICTPSALVRLLNKTDFGVDLKRLNTFVLDDCERLNEVYLNEIKFFQLKIKEMLKSRANKELKVQYILASRIWCDFMEPLAKKAPNTLICITAFQECVLYSKSSMSISFVDEKKKIDSVLEFLYSIEKAKRTVIVCRDDDEVDFIEEELKKRDFVVFAANEKMSIESLYSLSSNWAEYEEPLKGPILVCCDGNLTHLNITDAHYLLQYSLPSLFSMFSKRFAVLTDNYPSIFGSNDNVVKIKILLESKNVEQLPKILHFIRRCEHNLPEALNEICNKVLKEKDVTKAKCLVPICDNMLGFGDCPDFWNCKDRHSYIQEFDEPSEWMPKSGFVTFKILHFHNAVKYSVRLISNIVNGKTTKYPQTYSSLSLKMGLYYSKTSNRKLHGIPKVGDICAVALKDNFFERCQVVEILTRHEKTGEPKSVRVKLIDEEKLETTRDVFLYYLPKELASQNSHVALVRLATVQPKDRDITYSDIAVRELRSLTDKYNDLYQRARIITTVGNSIIVDTLESCQDLTSSKETVVRYNLKEELLKKHAITNPDHLVKLEKIAPNVIVEPEKEMTVAEAAPVLKEKPRWAFLQSEDFQPVYVTTSESPDTFFVRLEKFDDCLELLEKDIQKHMTDAQVLENPQTKDIVLAKYPSDSQYYRARIESLDKTAKCFFVDHGDWGNVDLKDIYSIPDKFISVLPFQAIECRMLGIKPPSENWNEYSTNWFSDQCVQGIDLKTLYAKYFTKEEAVCTNGYKYGIVLVDTNGDEDIVINNSMLNLNLARELKEEVEFLKDLNFQTVRESDGNESQSDWEEEYEKFKENKALMPPVDDANKKSLFDHGKLIRSVPLVNSDDEFDDDRWDVEIDYNEFIKPGKDKKFPALEQSSVVSSVSTKGSDFEVIPKPKILELDSDDLSSAESNVVTEKVVTPKIVQITDEVKELQTLRRPKLVWTQNVNTISFKIELIGVEKYDLKIEARHIKFATSILDTNYGFEFDLYGFVDVEKCYHETRGLYIFVRLVKVLKKNWLSLTKDGGLKKWILYDPDSIEASSSEEENDEDRVKEMVNRNLEESESDDDSFVDDTFR